jgi:hypothetical protein
LFLATRQGLDPTYKRKYKIIGASEVDPNNLDPDTSYLMPIAQNKFINLNPYLPGFNSTVFYSAFTRLFFFENYPGFKLLYKSPNGIVKIFEYTGEPPQSEWITIPTATPTATPATATPTPSATPSASPSIELNASNTSNASSQTNATNASNSTNSS